MRCGVRRIVCSHAGHLTSSVWVITASVESFLEVQCPVKYTANATTWDCAVCVTQYAWPVRLILAHRVGWASAGDGIRERKQADTATTVAATHSRYVLSSVGIRRAIVSVVAHAPGPLHT